MGQTWFLNQRNSFKQRTEDELQHSLNVEQDAACRVLSCNPINISVKAALEFTFLLVDINHMLLLNALH